MTTRKFDFNNLSEKILRFSVKQLDKWTELLRVAAECDSTEANKSRNSQVFSSLAVAEYRFAQLAMYVTKHTDSDFAVFEEIYKEL